MAYTLQALIAKAGTLKRGAIEQAHVVTLKAGFEMIPFTSAFLSVHKLPFLPLVDEGQSQLPESIAEICVALTTSGESAYVEAEFFGGDGTQAGVVFRNGQIEVGPIVEEEAINLVIAELGDTNHFAMDAFEELGLGGHRETDAWLS
jgi:hypothetical protein